MGLAGVCEKGSSSPEGCCRGGQAGRTVGVGTPPPPLVPKRCHRHGRNRPLPVPTQPVGELRPASEAWASPLPARAARSLATEGMLLWEGPLHPIGNSSDVLLVAGKKMDE